MEKLQAIWARPWVGTGLGALLLVLAAWLVAAAGKWMLRRGVLVLSQRTAWQWDDAMLARGVFRHLARILPLFTVRYGIVLVPGVPAWAETVIARITMALVVFFAARGLSAALAAVGDWYETRPGSQSRPIRGYLQLSQIFVFLMCAIVVIAVLVNESALTLLAGLSAVSAVLLLIFKDTILSVVASVQLSSNDMVRVGDWIAVPDDNVDGDVLEIALHTVKVVNWDQTISTVPTWHLISKSFRNYRHMYETGRRIRRAVHIDANSVRCLDEEDVGKLRQLRLLADYFERKEKELAAWNDQLGAAGKVAMNRRRLTNLGTFRAYVEAYVEASETVNTKLFWAVRQLDPGPTGIPIQIYGYTVETGFVDHHHATDDIFEHLFAILPEFGLRLFQEPTGLDLRAGLGAPRREIDGGAEQGPPRRRPQEHVASR